MSMPSVREGARSQFQVSTSRASCRLRLAAQHLHAANHPHPPPPLPPSQPRDKPSSSPPRDDFSSASRSGTPVAAGLFLSLAGPPRDRRKSETFGSAWSPLPRPSGPTRSSACTLRLWVSEIQVMRRDVFSENYLIGGQDPVPILCLVPRHNRGRSMSTSSVPSIEKCLSIYVCPFPGEKSPPEPRDRTQHSSECRSPSPKHASMHPTANPDATW